MWIKTALGAHSADLQSADCLSQDAASCGVCAADLDQQVRHVSEQLCQPLVTDYGIQSMPVLVLLSQLLPTLYPVAVLWNPPGESTSSLEVPSWIFHAP